MSTPAITLRFEYLSTNPDYLPVLTNAPPGLRQCPVCLAWEPEDTYRNAFGPCVTCYNQKRAVYRRMPLPTTAVCATCGITFSPLYWHDGNFQRRGTKFYCKKHNRRSHRRTP